MLNFIFIQSVKVLSGPGSIKQIGELVRQAGYHKAFLVCTQGMVKRGLALQVQEILKTCGIGSVIYDKAIPDPPAEIVNQGAAICKAENCDCVLGLGGGSSMDAAKGINVLRFNEGSILDYAAKPMAVCSGLIMIPTTSGTGSELSDGAVISDLEHETKVPIRCVDCMSEYVLLDPELTLGVPRRVTLETGLDTFSHAAEAYTSTLSNPLASLVCETVMETVVRYLPIACANGTDLPAREKLQSAAALGGWMLFNSCSHVGHSFAHVTGARLHLVHGAACAYGLSAVLKVIAPVTPEKVKRIGEILGVIYSENESAETIGVMAAAAYRAFVTSLELSPAPTIDASELDALAQAIVDEPLAKFCPVQITKETALNLVKDAFL